MTYALNETHNPSLKSRIDSANQPDSDFPIQNLPFAVFRRKKSHEDFRGGVAIGDQIVDLAALVGKHYMSGDAEVALKAAAQSQLNDLMALPYTYWSALRLALSQLLRAGASESLAGLLVAQDTAEYAVPANIGDYTDFYTSIYHATNIGKLFRPDNPLMPNYQWIPIGYHGRSSSIVISGKAFKRPIGQTKALDDDVPRVGPCQRLDYELELGIFAGTANILGQPISIDVAEQHVFGLCILNDWSARDIQAWEYQPLGPFLAKNFASHISPWIVTMEALAPYRVAFERQADEPQPLAYLDSQENRQRGSVDIAMDILLETQQMRDNGEAPVSLGTSNYCYAYWTIAQMITHHTMNGCNLQPGDLLGTGTLSGPDDSKQTGALIELTRGGKSPVTLPNGETRTFLVDGDKILMTAWSKKADYVRIGFGTVEATILPALDAEHHD